MEKGKRNVLELTQSQLMLWAGQQLNPEIPLHNTAHSFDIDGLIEEAIFKESVDQLIKKVDVFRAIFQEEGGIPYQSIVEDLDFEITVFDFTSGYSDEEIQVWLRERSRNLLNISQRCFDMALIKVEPRRYIWFLNMHHLITDAVSATLVFRYLSEIYVAKKNEETVDKTYPSYKDYVDYERNQRTREENEEIKRYWQEKTENKGAIPCFYGNTATKVQTASTRMSLKLGKDRCNLLNNLAENPEIKGWTRNLTLFNLLSTLYASFIYRVSGQKSFSFGAPMHNRATRDFRNTIGLFIEIFPIHVEIEEEDTFGSLYQRLKLETNEYLRYAQPGMVTPEISGSFNSILNFISASFSDFDGHRVKSEWIHPGHIDMSHHMRCHVVDFDDTGELEILFDFNHAIFDDALIQEVPQHFLKLFDAQVENMNTQVREPGLTNDDKLSPPEKLAPESTPALVLDQFHTTVKKVENKIALHNGARSLNYGELNQRSNQLANFLQNQGVGLGTNVGIYMHRSTDYIISVLAVMKTGGTFIPIPSDQSPGRISFIVEDANCVLLLTNSKLVSNINGNSVQIVELDTSIGEVEKMESSNVNTTVNQKNLAYILYTSGSTGNPKGVQVSHGAFANYISWAKDYYRMEVPFIFPLFTSIGFDLSLTSTFLPLVTAGELVIYKESEQGADIALMEVLEQNRVNSIKLTPSHLALIQGVDLPDSLLRTMIVGGEDFKTTIASSIQDIFGSQLRIFNEYGPTEATVGCIVALYDNDVRQGLSVPIGSPITNAVAKIFDEHMNLVPGGVVGSLYIGGAGLADGYLNLPDLTDQRFIDNPFEPGKKLYNTGDLARINAQGDFEYLGRADEQVKLRGHRIELTDIEANLLTHEEVDNAAVVLIENERAIHANEVVNCNECGLPSNYPKTDFDENGVCHICTAFKGYKTKAQRYFKTEEELRNILISQRGKNPNYDCLSLLSGGKDSTYILAQLVNMGLKVLSFTLDNGYISEQAKRNIDKIVQKLGVDHIYGETEHMNKIFVDSLHRHHNVCNGCFKTIYTLSTKIALEKKIPFVVTGLSRGQFFETRLTEEMFWDEHLDVATIDDTILEARKLYHQEEDAVKTHLDVSMFDYGDTFQKVQFIDFYRYSDVSLEEMLKFLKEKVDWVRPTDTGRSTNCLINQVGIYVHKKEKGYSNYSFPYSWDVRMGHKTRTETLEEINEVIDEVEVKKIMSEIGYLESRQSELEQKRLVGYYTGEVKLGSKELSDHLKKKLPKYMVPTYFKFVRELPLTSNGKVDKSALKSLNISQLDLDTPFIVPNGEIEELLASIWKAVLHLEQVGIHDSFIELGGHSLAAIRITARINEEIETKFPLNKIFEFPTIAEYAVFIEEQLKVLLQE